MPAGAAASPAAPIRVGVIEDQPLLNGMLADLITHTDGLEFVGSAHTIAQARAQFPGWSADVLTMDIELPDGNGISLGVSLRRRHPHLGIVLLSAYDLMDMLLDMPDDVRGGWSYLSKNSALTASTLESAIIASARGETVLDSRLVDLALPRAGSALESLTDRQYKVLQLLAQGLSNAGISQRLGIADKSVQNHLTAIYAALNIDPSGDTNARVKATLVLLEESHRIP